MGAHMRSIRLPDLLIEVDNELDWSRHFIPPSRRRERSVQDICEVVASVMAYGCNIGPETMARVTNDVSYKAIRRLADWQFSEDKLRGALADLVNGISRCDAAEVWGHARTSSSDGQRYLFPRKTLKATYSHRLGDYALARNGTQPTFWTRISILALARSQDTPPLRRIPRLFALNPAHHLRR